MADVVMSRGRSRNFSIKGGAANTSYEKKAVAPGCPHTVRCPVPAKIRGYAPVSAKLRKTRAGAPPLNLSLIAHWLLLQLGRHDTISVSTKINRVLPTCTLHRYISFTQHNFSRFSEGHIPYRHPCVHTCPYNVVAFFVIYLCPLQIFTPQNYICEDVTSWIDRDRCT